MSDSFNPTGLDNARLARIEEELRDTKELVRKIHFLLLVLVIVFVGVPLIAICIQMPVLFGILATFALCYGAIKMVGSIDQMRKEEAAKPSPR